MKGFGVGAKQGGDDDEDNDDGDGDSVDVVVCCAKIIKYVVLCAFRDGGDGGGSWQ